MSKAIVPPPIGAQFGKLTFTGKIGTIHNSVGRRLIAWECTCSCGGEASLYHAATLCCGRRSSCGCRTNESPTSIPAGTEFGQLTSTGVVSFIALSNGKRRSACECTCACGTPARMYTVDCLKTGNTTSCGCGRIDAITKHGQARRGHESPEYIAYQGLMQRCYNQNLVGYENYGGRGICVCERWRNSFEDFLADVGKRPSGKHSLDRFPDNNGNYEPGNVMWALKFEQGRNRRTNRLITINGQTLCLSEWADSYGIHRQVFYERLKTGMDPLEALTKPIQRHHKVTASL